VDLGAEDLDQPVMAEAAKRNRVRKDVRRPREGGIERRVDGEAERKRPGDPADRRARRDVGLHDGDVACCSCEDADDEPDEHGEHHPAAGDGLLRQRRGPGGDEQRHERAEADQVAEREVDDPGQAVDERVADRDQAVDAARAQPREEDLDGETHPRRIMRRSTGPLGGTCRPVCYGQTVVE
jgi:hypothetical protein